MTFSLNQLSPDDDLRTQAETLVANANLPTIAKWRAGVTWDDLGSHATPMARFNDGKYLINANEQEWLFDGGVSKHGLSIRWNVTVDLHGDIMATALPTGKQERGPDPELLLVAMGCGQRTIGSIGELVPLFSNTEASRAQLNALGMEPLPTILVRVVRADMARGLFLRAMNPPNPR